MFTLNRKESIAMAFGVAVAALGAGTVMEAQYRAMSTMGSVGYTLTIGGYDPDLKEKGLRRDIQDHAVAALLCTNVSEKEAREAGDPLITAACRAYNRHSLFYGPDFRELVAQELPKASDPRVGGWQNHSNTPRIPFFFPLYM